MNKIRDWFHIVWIIALIALAFAVAALCVFLGQDKINLPLTISLFVFSFLFTVLDLLIIVKLKVDKRNKNDQSIETKGQIKHDKQQD